MSDTNGLTPLNQCDGCRAGYPLTDRGNHKYPDGSFMSCTKYRYHEPGELKEEVEKLVDKY